MILRLVVVGFDISLYHDSCVSIPFIVAYAVLTISPFYLFLIVLLSHELKRHT